MLHDILQYDTGAPSNCKTMRIRARDSTLGLRRFFYSFLTNARAHAIFLMYIAGKKKKDDDKFEVSAPFNIKHDVHVDFNSATGLRGLPQEWETMITSAGIGKKDVVENKDALLEVLEFQSRYQQDQKRKEQMAAMQKAADAIEANGAGSQSSTVSSSPPKSLSSSGSLTASTTADDDEMPESFMGVPEPAPLPSDKPIRMEDLVNSEDDPNELYLDQRKIGEGYESILIDSAPWHVT
jgi:hypothetical protein